MCIVSNVWSVYFLVMCGVLLKYIYNCHTIKTGNSIHHGPRHQSQTRLLVVHPTSQVYLLEYLAPSVQILGALPLGQIAGVAQLGLLGWAAGVGSLKWGWGWGGWPRNFMDAEILPAVWYQFFNPHWVVQVCSWEGFFIVLRVCFWHQWGHFMKG